MGINFTVNDFLFTPAVRALDLARIVDALEDIRDFLGCPPQVNFSIEVNGVTAGRIKNMELREGQQVNASVTLLTASGNPAAYEKGSASWSSSDDTVVTVTQDASDELKAVIVGVNGSTNGSVVITFTCDGDPDAGPGQVRNIIGTLDVTCTQGEAMVVQITTDTPVDVPPAGTSGGPGRPLRDAVKKS